MKNEFHYENPVNLFISKNYDDAETAQEFIKDLAGEQLSVSKGRNGDYLYVSIEGADEDIDAFLEVYKDEYGDIVKDFGVEGWVTPEDVYYASVEGKKELLGESHKNERGNDDYLQEVWDSLEGSWDKDKFDMGKVYDSEYDCECITITSKDNEEVRAKIYIEDYEGRHPVAFNVVYRYPGDKGVGVMGTYEFQSTDMDGLGEEVFDYFDDIKQKAAVASFESDLQAYADAVKEDKYDKQAVVADGWDFDNSVEYDEDIVRDNFKKKYDGKTYLLHITFNPSTKKVSDVKWDISAIESKKSKSRFGKMVEGNASDYDGKYYVDIEDEDEDTLYSSDMEFDSSRKASLWAFDELEKCKDDDDVFQASVYQLFINDDGDLDHELVEVIHKSDACESKKSEAEGPTTGDDALKQMQMAFKQYNGKTTGEIAADIRYDVATALDMPADEVDDVMQSFGLDNIYILRAEGVSPKVIAQKMLKANNVSKKSEDFDMNKAFFQAKKAITDWMKNQKHKTLEWLYTDGRKSPTSYPSGIWDFEWDTGNGMATAELKVSPYETRMNSWNDSLDFALKSGPKGKYMYYTSAEDALYALDKLIRDTEFKGESKKSESDKTSWALEYLVKIAKEKGLKVSWEDANEICITVGTFPHQDHIFVTDDAPGKVDTSLELYVPAAHINAFGLTLQDVLDYLDDPIGKRDAVQFKNGNRSGKVEAKKSEGLPPKKLGSNRQYRSRADLINKMKTLDAVEITTPAQFNDIHSKQWLHTAGYAMDINGNLVGQTYFGDKDGKWYYATTKTFQGDYLPECKESKKLESSQAITPENIEALLDEKGLVFRKEGTPTRPTYTVYDSIETKELAEQTHHKVGNMFYIAMNPGGGAFISVLCLGGDYYSNNFVKSDIATMRTLRKYVDLIMSWFKYPNNDERVSESLTLKQKELKDMARFGQAEDITTISDAEAKELKKKGIETVGISRGVYGMNGALLRDNEGNKYVITARSSNLFYFV